MAEAVMSSSRMWASIKALMFPEERSPKAMLAAALSSKMSVSPSTATRRPVSIAPAFASN
ncbi:MAG: hypothetical protein JWO93_227 [Micrococcaceae bacterium]|nr:hypothetical protein [Micrococcaceae bacterium]